MLGGQRMNTVYFFTVDRMTVTDIGVTFSPNYVLRHSKPGKKLDRSTIGHITRKRDVLLIV